MAPGMLSSSSSSSSSAAAAVTSEWSTIHDLSLLGGQEPFIGAALHASLGHISGSIFHMLDQTVEDKNFVGKQFLIVF